MLNKKFEALFKKILLGLAICSCLVYLIYRWNFYRSMDNPPPEITFKEDLLLVSLDITEEDLLKDVTAVDSKDGDVSDTLIVESLSNLMGNNERIVTYAAFDKDHHVGKAQRRIRYTDYTPLRFSLEKPLERTDNKELSELLAPLKAFDCIDGDISNQIAVLDRNSLNETDEYEIESYTVQVTNSCGQLATLEIPLRIPKAGDDLQKNLNVITLSDYLVYCNRGDRLDLDSYVSKIDLGTSASQRYRLKITSELDTSVPGSYLVTYTVTWGNEKKASCDLIVVVEE